MQTHPPTLTISTEVRNSWQLHNNVKETHSSVPMATAVARTHYTSRVVQLVGYAGVLQRDAITVADSNGTWCSVTVTLPIREYTALGVRWDLLKPKPSHSPAYTVQVPCNSRTKSPFLRSQQFLRWSRNSPHIMEHKGSLQGSQQPNICTYPEPDQSSEPTSFTYFVTYFLTPWTRDILEKLTGSHLVKKFPTFYGTRRFITAFTRARHLFLSWATSIDSMPSHPTSWRSVLTL